MEAYLKAIESEHAPLNDEGPLFKVITYRLTPKVL